MSAGFVRRIGAQAAGQTTHRNAKGVCTVPDYKAMYFELFRASVQAVQLFGCGVIGAALAVLLVSVCFWLAVRVGGVIFCGGGVLVGSSTGPGRH